MKSKTWMVTVLLVAAVLHGLPADGGRGAEDDEEEQQSLEKVDEIQLRLLRRITQKEAAPATPAEDLTLPATYEEKPAAKLPPKKVEVWEGDEPTSPASASQRKLEGGPLPSSPVEKKQKKKSPAEKAPPGPADRKPAAEGSSWPLEGGGAESARPSADSVPEGGGWEPAAP